MTLLAGSPIYDIDGSSYRLAREIGSGGQGSVWTIDGQADRVAKFYHSGLSDTDAAKIVAMCRMRTDSLSSISAWPMSVLKSSRSGKPTGLLMRKITDYQAIHQLYGLKSRLRTFPDAQLPFLIHVATNTARAFATIHAAGQVIGDVNHSNLMVSRSGTVVLIDCDSFQIKDGPRTFRCPVGVPEFTPPELQGTNFGNIDRTSQHDVFGLSVLVFYLLFLGRHPFMGVYDAKSDDIVSLDQAIGQYRFPYALGSASNEVRLPMFVPRLTDYPTDLAQLFIRCFTREGITRGRPSATEWVGTLNNLSKTLKTCTTNPNHLFFARASGCPWCRAEGVLGTPIFGIRITVVGGGGFNLSTIWAEITTIKPTAEQLQKPQLSTIRTKYTPDPKIPEIAKKRRLHKIGSIGIVMSISVLAVALLLPAVALVAIVISLVIARQLWNKGSSEAKPFIAQYDNALSEYRKAELEFDHCSVPPTRYSEMRSQLESQKRSYENLAGEKAKKLVVLNAAREVKQRQRFLETFRIEDVTLPNIGPKNKLILRTWGIEDAWDVDRRKIEGIKGFGLVKVQTLVDWRTSKETLFRFDPRQPLDSRDLQILEQEFAQKAQTLQSAITAAPAALRQVLTVWQAQRRQQVTILNLLAENLAEAEVSRMALGHF